MNFSQTANPHLITNRQTRWLLNIWSEISGTFVFGPYFFEKLICGQNIFQFLQNVLLRLVSTEREKERQSEIERGREKERDIEKKRDRIEREREREGRERGGESICFIVAQKRYILIDKTSNII